MLGAVLVHPDRKEVIPFAPEPHERRGSHKNDCERNAAKRLLNDFRREHLHLKIIITEEGLSSFYRPQCHYGKSRESLMRLLDLNVFYFYNSYCCHSPIATNSIFLNNHIELRYNLSNTLKCWIIFANFHGEKILCAIIILKF